MNPVEKIERVIASQDGYDEDALRLALSYAKLIRKKHFAGTTEVILLTDTMAQLRSTSLTGMLGLEATKILEKGGKLKLPYDATLRHATLRTIGFGGRNAIIIPFYASDKMLDAVDGLRGTIGVVVVPDLKGSADGWIKRWNPKIHGKQYEDVEPSISDEVVANALDSLTSMSNISHDAIHPRDKEYANEILRILFVKGHTLVPHDIKSYLVRRGWRPKAADEIANLAGRIAALKSKPPLGKIYDPHGRYSRWKNVSENPN